MIIHEIDESKFDVILKDDVVLLDFYATWCGPCKMMGSILEDYSKDHSDVNIYKINVDKYEDLARKYGVMTIPTLVLYKKGKLIKGNVGVIPLNELEKWINE